MMKVGIAGSRTIIVPNIGDFLPSDTTEIISGGTKGVDTCAREYAQQHNIPLREFLPDYEQYGRAAPIRRNDLIIDNSDMMLVFWDGQSRGTRYVIERCKDLNKSLRLIHMAQPPI